MTRKDYGLRALNILEHITINTDLRVGQIMEIAVPNDTNISSVENEKLCVLLEELVDTLTTNRVIPEFVQVDSIIQRNYRG